MPSFGGKPPKLGINFFPALRAEAAKPGVGGLARTTAKSIHKTSCYYKTLHI